MPFEDVQLQHDVVVVRNQIIMRVRDLQEGSNADKKVQDLYLLHVQNFMAHSPVFGNEHQWKCGEEERKAIRKKGYQGLHYDRNEYTESNEVILSLKTQAFGSTSSTKYFSLSSGRFMDDGVL
jgi:hypothetical protein